MFLFHSILVISLISELITSVFNFLTIRDLSQKFFCLLISDLIHLSSGYILFLILILLKHTFANECSNYCIIVLISHASKVMLKILQARLSNT